MITTVFCSITVNGLNLPRGKAQTKQSRTICRIRIKRESFYWLFGHSKETILNQQLIKILLLIKGQGEDTILLTECRERRAKELCSYWGISQLFDKQFYKENYSGVSKYQFLQAIVAETKSVVLFENEHYEIQKALKYNLYENQIIKVKF